MTGPKVAAVAPANLVLPPVLRMPIKRAKLVMKTRKGRFVPCGHTGKRDRDPVASPTPAAYLQSPDKRVRVKYKINGITKPSSPPGPPQAAIISATNLPHKLCNTFPSKQTPPLAALGLQPFPFPSGDLGGRGILIFFKKATGVPLDIFISATQVSHTHSYPHTGSHKPQESEVSTEYPVLARMRAQGP